MRMEFLPVKLVEKTCEIDLMNVFSGDSAEASHKGEFYGRFDLCDCGLKKLRKIAIHAVGSCRMTVKGKAGSVSFDVEEGCSTKYVNLDSEEFTVECTEVTSTFALQKIQFRYSPLNGSAI